MMTSDSNGGPEEFERFRAALSRRFGEKVYASWMSDLEYEDKTEDCVTLSTDTEFKRDALGERFIGQLKDAWSEVVGPIRWLRVVARRRLGEDARRVDALRPRTREESFRAAVAPSLARLNGHAQGHAQGLARPEMNGHARPVQKALKPQSDRVPQTLDELAAPVDETQTFETFAVDETNSLAFAAARQVFVDSARAEVVYLSGQSGVGKSHLLFAVANEYARRFGPGRCAYLTYAGLQSGCVDAVFSKSTLSLQREMLSRDVVLIDDIHFLLTSPRTQSELLNFLNAAMASGKRLVIAGEMSPAKLAEAGFNRPLADRLAGGLAVSLHPGDAAHRERVLRKRLETHPADVEILDEAIAYVAEYFPNSLRETIGAMKQLALEYAGKGIPVGRREAVTALRARRVDVQKKPTFAEVAAACAAAFAIAPEEFHSRGQSQRLVRARHIFAIICREDLKESFPQIARYLSKDHTTIMSGFKRGHALVERDKQLQATLASIRETLGLVPV